MEPSEERLDEQRLRAMSSGELVQHAVEEARLLARAEVAHAKDELKAELKAAQRAAALAGATLVATLCGLSVLLVALALALPLNGALAALLVGLFLLLLASASALAAYRSFPRQPLPKTQARLKQDLTIAREYLQ